MARHFLLTYQYTEDYWEKRAPLRPAHLAHIAEKVGQGRILGSGVLPERRGAMLIFWIEDPQEAREFAEADPYFRAGLIASWHVEPWDVAEGVPAVTHPAGA